jgi:glucose 1-dehydrogenase
VDILVNNAAIFRPARLFELSDEAFWDVLQVNLGGPFYASRAVAAHLLERGAPGRIVMITSVSAIIAQRHQPHYAAAKAGLEMLAKVMAVELAPHAITVNCVAPGGPIVTDYTAPAAQAPGFEATVKRRVPMGRPGYPADVAGAVAYLVSDEAAFVTGASLVVDGGLVLARD